VPRQTQTERQRRSAAVRSNDHSCSQHARRPLRPDPNADHLRILSRVVDRGPAHGYVRLELASGRDGVPHEQRVELAAPHRPARQPRGIPSLDDGAVRAGDAHASDTQAAALNVAGKIEAAQQRKRPGIHGVAAQLVARKRRPIDEGHPRAGASEHQRRNGPGRAGADNQTIKHLVE